VFKADERTGLAERAGRAFVATAGASDAKVHAVVCGAENDWLEVVLDLVADVEHLRYVDRFTRLGAFAPYNAVAG